MFGEISPCEPVAVLTKVSNPSVRFFRAAVIALSVVFRVNAGKAGPRSGQGVKQSADEMNNKNDRTRRFEVAIFGNDKLVMIQIFFLSSIYRFYIPHRVGDRWSWHVVYAGSVITVGTLVV